MADRKTRPCLVCRKTVRLKADGVTLYEHPCHALPEEKGPWFTASFDQDCDTCGIDIMSGDRIRSDGQGGWECCGEDEPQHSLQAAAVAETAEEFLSGPETLAGPSAEEFLSGDDEPESDLNVSGQPKARYEWRGKQNLGYLVKDPRTGDFNRYKNKKPKGWTRATTFNKAATDQNSLSDWGKRNVLVGAAMRPDLVAQAHGVAVDDKATLMPLVAQLEEAAGAKVSANVGTAIHEYTERLDGDPRFTLSDVPPQYRGACKLYLSALKEHGLIPVPGLIERTVFIPEFGGVVGTFDRVYLHEASGKYLIGDVKTGKTLKYGMDEIETQEWIYARGINLYGVYDWNEDEWQKPGDVDDPVNVVNWGPQYKGLHVSEEWGVVIHLPVQGDDAGTCKVVRADLQRGKRHAQVCHDVRVQRSNKPKPELFTADLLMDPVPAAEPIDFPSWERAFSQADDRQHLAQMYTEACGSDLTADQLKVLVEIGRARLTELSASQ